MNGLMIAAACAAAGLGAQCASVWLRTDRCPAPLTPGPRVADPLVVRRLDLYDWELNRWA